MTEQPVVENNREEIQYPHLSKSAVEKYVNCGEAYRRRYVVKEPVSTSSNLVFGIAFHNVLEEYMRFKSMPLNPALPAFDPHMAWEQIYAKEMSKHASILYAVDSPEEQLDTGHRMLDTPDLIALLNEYKPMTIPWVTEEGEHMGPAIEMPLEFPIPNVDVPFIGYIDVLCDDGIPMDFKTSGKKWDADKAQNELQPSYYLYGLEMIGMPSPSRIFRHVVITKTARPSVTVWETTRSQQEIDWAIKLVSHAYEGIAKGVFVPNPLAWSCSVNNCEFYMNCRGGAGD